MPEAGSLPGASTSGDESQNPDAVSRSSELDAAPEDPQSEDEETGALRGQVIEVSNDRELILNLGLRQGVQAGDFFSILGEKSRPIVDPTSGEVLGEVKVVKTVVRVEEVGTRFCIGRTFRTRRVNEGGNSSFGLFSPPNWVDRVETLKRSARSKTPGGLENDDLIVQVGDIAEQTSFDPADNGPSLVVWE